MKSKANPKGGGAAAPTETFTLTSKAIGITYTPTATTGSPGTMTSGSPTKGYDLATNKVG